MYYRTFGQVQPIVWFGWVSPSAEFPRVFFEQSSVNLLLALLFTLLTDGQKDGALCHWRSKVGHGQAGLRRVVYVLGRRGAELRDSCTGML